MGLHIGILFLLAFLTMGCRKGWIPYEKYMNRHDLSMILLIILVGNCLGMLMTWQNNQDLLLGKSWFQKNSYGKGSYSKTLEVEVQGEDAEEMVIQIPEQLPTEEELAQEEENADTEEKLRTQIRMAVAAENEGREDDERYYLPQKLEDKNLLWKKKFDSAGNMLAAMAFLGALVIVIARTREQGQKQQKKREELLMDYPSLVLKLMLLVQAGMTVRRAFSKTALDYKRGKRKEKDKRIAYEEMLAAYYEMESGIPEGEAYYRFGERCQEPKYKTLASLLNQNLKKGSRGLTEMLEREATEALEDRKRKARILGEAAATKLLVPMILMLMVVLTILIVPACFAFYA